MKKKLFSIWIAATGLIMTQGCKDSNLDYEVGRLEISPTKQSRYVEGFPLWKFIDYGDEHSPISNPTSVDIEFPHGRILQQGNEYGFIDASQENLPYRIDHNFIHTDAQDIATSENSYWYVKGDDVLYQESRPNNSNSEVIEQLTQWSLIDSEFTEVAVETEGTVVWLLDNRHNRLYRFNPEQDKLWPYFSLPESLNFTDLSIIENTITLTYQFENDFYMTRFAISDPISMGGSDSIPYGHFFEFVNLTEESTWHISGFDGKQINDASYMPDGRLIISLDQPSENLYIIADEGANAGDGPVPVTSELILLEELPLPNSIRQPSGLSLRPDGNWYLVTDQAEVFVLNSDFSEVIHSGQLEFANIGCNQGCTEGISSIDSDNFYVITDAKVIAEFGTNSQGFTNKAQYSLPFNNNVSFAGINLDRLTGETYLVNDSNDPSETDILYTLDSNNQFEILEEQAIYRNDIANINSFDAKGVFHYESKIYVLSERFTQLLQLNQQGEIEHTFEFSHEDIASPSDLVISNNKIYIIGDHEDGQPTPPVTIYQLP